MCPSSCSALLRIWTLLLCGTTVFSGRLAVVSTADEAALGETTLIIQRTETPYDTSPKSPKRSPSPNHKNSPRKSPHHPKTSPHPPKKSPSSSPVSHQQPKGPYTMISFKGLSIPAGTGCPPEIFIARPDPSLLLTSPSGQNDSHVPSSPSLAHTGQALSAPALGPDTEAGTAKVPLPFISFLSLHNRLRIGHGVDPLTWDSKLEEAARKWVKKLPCAVVDHGKTETRGSAGNLNQGENMYTRGAQKNESSNLQDTIDEALTYWYSLEEPKYNYKMPHFSEETGHFTQVVWKGTKRIGCAITPSSCSKQGYYWHTMSCRYAPAGNVDGEFQNNVLKPK